MHASDRLLSAIPYYSTALSEASIVLHVCRIPTSYVYNFVILVTLIEMIALVSYLLVPSDIDPRVSLTLSVFLGVIFFQVRSPRHLPRCMHLTLSAFLGAIFLQIMISDLLPTTGYLTDMHYFTFYATVLVVAVALSHVIIFAIQAKAAARATVLRRVSRLHKSRRLLPAVVQLQRRVRGHLLRRRLEAQTLEAKMLNVSLIGVGGPASAPAHC